MTSKAAPFVREILHPTDFSACSEVAGQVARDYARHLGGRLHILHVVWAAVDAGPNPLLSKLADELGRDVPVVTAVQSGAPAGEILRYAARHHIDLIVLGTHGRTGVTRALLGSVAERVARTAPCPVLIVPQEGKGAIPAVTVEPETGLRHCLVCAATSEDLICQPCRARIRGEALERKLREERSGRT